MAFSPIDLFPASITAALEHLNIFNPDQYAKTRNFLNGTVSRLSPYITHGLVDIPFCVSHLLKKHYLSSEEKIIYEFAWREYYHHVWSHLNCNILQNIREPIWSGQYQDQLPQDIVNGSTGIPAIDQSVALLYEQGYLHNHTRMWLASYIVHLRKVDWKVGALWMYKHLLDGDLASNYLSWQWVAGTFSVKPYLFNAENVLRYAPMWDCTGTIIDQSYSDLEKQARCQPDCGAEPGAYPSLRQPDVFDYPPKELLHQNFTLIYDISEIISLKKCRLMHPWDLGKNHQNLEEPCIGILEIQFHKQFPWSMKRWAFVLNRLKEITNFIWIVDSSQTEKYSIKSNTLKAEVSILNTLNPGYCDWIKIHNPTVVQINRLFSNPNVLKTSFSKFYSSVNKDSILTKSKM